jgi:hypothetical protein
MAKVKVFNKNKFDIGVKLINPIREQNIKAGSFTILEEDDVYYLDTICSLFKRGMLIIDDNNIKENLGIIELDESIKTDEELITILKSNFNKMKSELAKIKEPHIIDSIYNIAKNIGSELSGGKLKYLSEYCGKDIFIDEI